MAANLKWLTAKEAGKLVGREQHAIWRWVREGRNGFPRPVRLTPNKAVWVEHEVKEWLAQRLRDR